MAEEIRLNRQASLYFKKKLRQMQVYIREEEDGWVRAEGLAGRLNYASMSPSSRDGLRGASDALKRLEVFQKGFEEHEQAIEEFDREAARLLNSIQYTDSQDVVLDGWANERVEIDTDLMNSILWGVQGPNQHIRTFFEAKGYTVDWIAGATAGASTIILTSPNGDKRTLQEGVDYYITDGKSYFYNNVRVLLEANGAKVEYKQSSGGGSTITVTMPIDSPFSTGGVAVATLVEGKDYFIGADNKAHFLGDAYGPPPPGAITPPPAPAQAQAQTPAQAPPPPAPAPSAQTPTQAPPMQASNPSNNGMKDQTIQSLVDAGVLMYNPNGKIEYNTETPLYKNLPENRNKDAYNTVIDQFNVENRLLQAADGQTYCNIFVQEVANAMGVELKGGAGVMADYLAAMANDDNSAWIKVDARIAQEWANAGYLVVDAWKNPKGSPNHVQIIRPETSDIIYKTRIIDGIEYGNPVAAQAGGINYNLKNVGDGYGKDKHPDVKYYVYTK